MSVTTLLIVAVILSVQHPHATFYCKPLSLANFKSFAGWLSRLVNQITDVQLIVFSCKKSKHDIHFNLISKICSVVICCERTIMYLSLPAY